MSLMAGARLGPYEIVEPIGKGGMGEVFKARDGRLDRFVAVKILPPEWAQDPAMQERFKREAQAIASLNHPNICALHDVGSVPAHEAGLTPSGEAPVREDGSGSRQPDSSPLVSYLVMELLQGETLAARIARGPLGLDDALDVAVPIADALEQAHRRGVVHRDLKPGNIMLTPTGPKLLDFGLARTPATPARRGPGSGSAPDAATVAAVPTTPLTTPGLLIGTLQYMAPEQLEGYEADARTDIFAFGTILHEMITGKRAFEGKSQVLLISSIATSEPPPLTTAEPATPPALEHVVKTCLAKNPDDRWQTARDLLAELKWIADGGAAATAVLPAAAGPRRRSGRLVYALAAAAVLAAAALAVPAYSYFQGPPQPAEIRYRVWSTPFDDTPHADGFFAVSQDGRQLVYRGDEDGLNDPNGLYLGRVGDVTWRRLPLTDEPAQPFWSPDGRYVAFVASGRLVKVDIAGGPPQDIAPAAGMLGGAWNADGTIIIGSAAGISRVSAEGGTPEVVVARGENETGLYWPHFLPDGRRFLYLAWSSDPANRAVMAASLDDPTPSLVLKAESNVAYTAAGHLVFHRGDAIYAQPFDAATLASSGEPTRIATQVAFSVSTGRGLFEVSRDGVLVYAQADPDGAAGGGEHARLWQPAWVDRAGRELAKVGSYQLYRGAEVSNDGTRIALHRHDETGGDIWIIEPSSTDTRLTYEPARDNSSPIWSPDGQHIVFGAQVDGKWALLRRLSDGRGTEEVLYESDERVVPMSWSPDGLRIVFCVSGSESNGDLWVLTLESADGAPAKDVKPEPLVATPFNETHGQISPDGRWIAYASNETKTDQYEVYVRPFPAGAGRWQVSRTGGDWPRWSRDGRELFFMSNNIPENVSSIFGTLSAAKVGAEGETFVPEPPAETLQIRAINLDHPGGDYPTYAVRSDGALLVFMWAQGVATAGAAPAPLVVGPDAEGGLTVARHWERRLTKK